ncbi:MAG: carboxypeptidase-like regulatory domain-containing protein, partial [Bacteroidales bacterium]|nr:carboxypeptidase-like regulatory domain-containing protein [Bacteroidales bacterium]
MELRRTAAILTFFLAACMCAYGQEGAKSSITGRVIEEESGQPVIQAGVQLLSGKDSTLVDGVVTDADGQFKLPCLSGDYILKISVIGLHPVFRDIHKPLSKNDLDLGAIQMSSSAIFLESAVIAAKAPPVTVIEDTVVYNAAAFRVAEDASLGELLKKIPGLEISGSTVTLHGKQVKKLLVGGRKFFGGDVKAGLKNISADMVENIRAYEMESDMTRLTGVDDGEEEPVLDITMKRGVMNNWRNRVALGGGTSERYMARVNATRMAKNDQISVVANLHNTGDEDVTKVTANNIVGNGSRGETSQSEAGLTFSKKGGNTEIGGSFIYNGSDRNASADARQQNILASSMSYVNSSNRYLTLKNDFKGNFELERKLPSDFTFLFNGILSYNGTNAFTDALSSNFKKDPYSIEGVDPADWLGIDIPDDPFKSFRVNTTRNLSQTIGDKFTGNFSVQLAKRMSKKGRSLSGKFTFILNGSDELQAHDYLTRYYKIKANPDSARLRKQYLQTLNPTRTYITQLVYSEPLHKRFYFQTIYTFTYKNTDNTKSFYSLEKDFPEWTLEEGLRRSSLVSSLPSGYETAYDPLFSSVGRYDYFSHRINLNLR